VTDSKEDTSRLSEDDEDGQVELEDEVTNLSFEIVSNKYEHMLIGEFNTKEQQSTKVPMQQGK
jgi:hypothetical protein